MEYEIFLNEKNVINIPTGTDIDKSDLNPKLFEFQKDIIRWALKRGRAAIFADCGLGKTIMQLEWAKYIPGSVLILAPLAVSHQTVREGQKFNIEVQYCRKHEDIKSKIIITNYEMINNFNIEYFTGIILDESSILKSFEGKFRNLIIEKTQKTPFKLACTATPAPNDYMELGNHAEFLNVISRNEMLAMFFIHDGKDIHKWRIKGHAQDKFWQWVAEWAVVLRKPSDLGYEDNNFILPKLNIQSIEVETPNKGFFLFQKEAQTLSERITARRESIKERNHKVSEIVNNDDFWLIYCNLNKEGELLRKYIPYAVEVKGSDSIDYKEKSLMDFANSKIRILISKPRIAGFGMNFQHCNNIIFVGLSDSYEQFYQAVRRCWRFGQKREVNCYIVTADTEGAVVSNIKRKESGAMKMFSEMVKHTHVYSEINIKGQEKKKEDYIVKKESGDNWIMFLGDSIDIIKDIDTDSIHYSIFSPPFASLYTYSDSIRDLGNSKNYNEFFSHFKFLVKELYRVIMPGRLLSFHCMNLPTSKEKDGIIGLRDFRGDLIKLFQSEKFIFHSEIVIWKDPVIAAHRTKALGLLYKQLKKDSCMSRQGIPEYLVIMRKPGDNQERVNHTEGDFPLSMWQTYASPVWMDINPSDTLQHTSVREDKDEKHICPLQLEVIERAIKLYTNENDIVLSPFAGIGSEGYVSLSQSRKFIGIELKESYWKQACENLKLVKAQNKLF